MVKKSSKEILMYIIFGALTTVVSWCSFAIFTKIIPDISIFGLTLNCTDSANVLSWICAVLVAFITNKLWVFESKILKASFVFKELCAFVTSRLLTGAIEWFGFPLLIALGLNQTVFNIEGMIAKVIISIVVTILNFVFSKVLVFKNTKTSVEQNR